MGDSGRAGATPRVFVKAGLHAVGVAFLATNDAPGWEVNKAFERTLEVSPDETGGTVFWDAYVAPEDSARVKALIADRTPNVKSVTFITKAQAYHQQVKRNPEAYRLLGRNPLPDTLRARSPSASR